MAEAIDWQSIGLSEDIDYEELYEYLKDRPEELESLVKEYLSTDHRWLENERKIQEVIANRDQVLEELKQISENNERFDELVKEVKQMNVNTKTTTITETIYYDNEYTYYSDPIQRVIDINELRQRMKKSEDIPDLNKDKIEENNENNGSKTCEETQTNENDENIDLSVIYDGFTTNDPKYEHKMTEKFERIKAKIGAEVFAASNGILTHSWKAAQITKIINLWNVAVCFKDKSIIGGTFLSLSLIAYNIKSNSRLTVGERVIAYLDEIESPFNSQRELYSGTVAEPAKHTNGYRYLIFFDKRTYRYVRREDIFLIYGKVNVENLFNEKEMNIEAKEYSDFLKNYIKCYPERPMLRLQRGDDRIKVRFDNKWETAKVVDTDWSLALIYFYRLDRPHSEWIYRGSRRLYDIYKECQISKSNVKHRAGRSTTRMTRRLDERSSQAFVEWNTEEDDKENESSNKQKTTESDDEIKILDKEEMTRKRKFKQTARKSTARPSIAGTSSGNDWDEIIDNELFYTKELPVEQLPETKCKPRYLTEHHCSEQCINVDAESEQFLDKNPFHVPIYVGYRREILRTNEKKVRILYRAPCGRRLRDPNEVYHYLMITKSQLDIDLFTFRPHFTLFRKSSPLKAHFYIQDITNGLERQPISCVNTVDKTDLGNVVYKADRFPHPDVEFSPNPDFLSCCDCTDNCFDSDSCSCQQLTLEASDAVRMSRYQFFGYNYKRLDDFVMTGVFECNSKCQCNERCPNRVVQNGIKCRLQLFKTLKKGWGVRVLHDVPKGTFLCIYAAQILNEEAADKEGKTFGDEYLADLDYIDVCETQKEGYESDVELSDDDYRETEEECLDEDDDEDEDYKCSGSVIKTDRQLAIEEKNIISGRRRMEEKAKNRYSIREDFFNENFCYSLDAKKMGNIGRYLNHSCEPNCFVQNVFVDSHDLRFPWVSFFAKKDILAYEELTWDYNYEIGSIPGRKMACFCGAHRCKKRLL